MLFQCLIILILLGLCWIPELQHELYMAPAIGIVTYVIFNQCPSFVRKMHTRKLTYEDLEDLQDTDPELRKRFQIVFTRIQQLGGAFCASVLVLYGFHVFENNKSFFESVGILGGLLSLYARIFGYIGNFCITFLHQLKRKHYNSSTDFEGGSKKTKPHANEPEETKKSDYVLQHLEHTNEHI